MADDEAVRLLEEALHLRQNGERAPGGTETWRDWDRAAERFLRARLDRMADDEAWGGRGPSASYAEWLAEGENGSEAPPVLPW